MREQLIEKIMEEVIKKVDAPATEEAPQAEKKHSSLTEFVGTGLGDSIGLVIANVDHSIHEAMNLDKKYRSIGILGARTGAGPQIMAADEAVKATNTEILAVELARDTKGGAGHGSLIIFGAEDVADARRAVEVALKELERTFGDVHANEAGHLEFQYTARASYACEKAFNAPIGKSFGLVVGAPAAIGIVLADTVVKAANVDVISYSSPAKGTSFTNEVILTFSGDSGAVRQALITAREVGLDLLGTLGGKPASTTVPYI
ncbi:propanediol utilization microcompartment protein PduB [Bacillus thermotolerans]|uniref:Propanediol utilization polyhedral body protein PduB n=1 Tax=Bacillus thermotolerans TaxID=1221996 RepID=A0A0F5HND3_BACTR|nr:propanediol utilization microcompartment protein PduB [Bacillus thermotolerans]KKB34525.1 Propanediol utilization polyhedral body protein PduB [Bacillus thermotolerans]KKB37838.1 Propanediol utilization polyhedral body protein PduB [Bacillus thermotolerans]KKB41383.1 Propanediol utilization polyhedral body protein PduB [Bacillus thermotolerans]